MSEYIINLDQKITMKTFIPEIYMDRIDRSGEPSKNIPDRDKNAKGVYRFYGICIDSNQIGYVKYHILSDSPTINIDRIEIDPAYQSKGYGSVLIKHSLIDLVADFPHIKSVIVCSSALAIPFYIKNDFRPYFGDNNLIKSI